MNTDSLAPKFLICSSWALPICAHGTVTLRGPGRPGVEKSTIEGKATEFVGASKIKNEIPVKK